MPVKAAATTLAALVGMLAVFLATTISVLAVLTGAGSPSEATNGADGAACVPGASAGAAGVRGEQLANAAVIVAVGTQMRVPAPGRLVALTAALTESGLRNLRYGDRDSLGLFQQRPSQGWGTPAQILDPHYSATQFYRHLIAVPGWQRMSVNNAAQAVQHSATSTAYAPHEPAARTLLHTITHTPTGACAAANPPPGGPDGPSPTARHTDTTPAGCPAAAANPVARAAIAFACAHRGTPYVWGGTGRPGFDCSGLTQAAYAAAGIHLPRTAQTQYTAGPTPPPAEPAQPGDLVFFGTNTHHITHVGLVISPTTMIDAPDTGQAVRLDPIGHTRLIGRTRPWASHPSATARLTRRGLTKLSRRHTPVGLGPGPGPHHNPLRTQFLGRVRDRPGRAPQHVAQLRHRERITAPGHQRRPHQGTQRTGPQPSTRCGLDQPSPRCIDRALPTCVPLHPRTGTLGVAAR